MPKLTTYQQYLQSIGELSQSQIQRDAKAIIEKFRPVSPTASPYAPVVFLVDFTTRKYVYMSETCFDLVGRTQNYFYETGLDTYLSNWHPSDFHTINTKVFCDNMQFIESVPFEKYPDFIISYNYRVKNAVDQFVTVLQRFSYIPSQLPAKPLGMVGIAVDITHFKNDFSVVHTIEEAVSTSSGMINKLVFKKVHACCEANKTQVLSKKEVEVLKWIAQGLSSKQIADHMKISTNTVNNHRKNMLAKTGCQSSSQLIRYAMEHGSL